MSDAKIDGQSVIIAAATDYQLPPAASDPQESAGGSRSALQKTVGVFKNTAKKTRDFGLKHRPEFTFDAKVPIFRGNDNWPKFTLEAKVPIFGRKNARYTLSNTHKDAKIDGQSVVVIAATDSELPPAASDPQEDAKIDGQSVVIAAATDYQLPPAASDPQESAGGSRSALQKTVGVFKKTAKKTRDFGLKHRPEFTFEAKFPIFGGKNQKPECNLIVEKKV